MDNAYRLVLQCLLPYYSDDGSGTIVRTEDVSVEFDVVDDTQTSLASDITTHPLVNGDSIADHMYKTPATMTVSGNFSLQGNKPTAFYGSSPDRLTNIETFFERLKDEGIFCRLTKLSKMDDSSVRFIARDNMVLNNIAWTERQNSLGFNFSFTQILVANVQTQDYDENLDDPLLPALTDASTLDFTDTLLDMNEVDAIVVQILNDNNMFEEGFLVVAQAYAACMVVEAGVLGVGAIVLTTIFSSSIALGLSIPVAGWVVVAVTAAAAGIAALITAIVKGNERIQAQQRFKQEAFKVYEDEEKQRAEVERFCNYVGTIHQNLQSLNERMFVYGFPTNENQECALNIDGTYFVFKVTKNNTTGKWSLIVDNASEGSIVASRDELTGFYDLSELTQDNYLFRVPGSGQYVYIMNMKAGQLTAGSASSEEIDAALADLTNYSILITSINMSQFKDLLKDVVENAMTR